MTKTNPLNLNALFDVTSLGRLKMTYRSLNISHLSLTFAAMTVGLLLFSADQVLAAAAPAETNFPPSFESYGDADLSGVGAVLAHRIAQVPFNLVATILFVCAILHTFMATKFMELSEQRHHAHAAKVVRGELNEKSRDIRAGLYHFLGEVEVIFGLWVVPLVIAIALFYDWGTVVNYVNHGVNLNEAGFVIVIMVLASTRPILKLAEKAILTISNALGGTLTTFWITIMTVGPLLGSFITEPAAMTISALLLSQKFYDLEPSDRLKYATLGLLFVNVSVGGTLTHFAAPPVLMVAGPWDWGTGFMLTNFGWKAVVGILIANGLYFFMFRRELQQLQSEYAVRRLKEEIAQLHVPRNLVEREMKAASHLIEERERASDVIEAGVAQFAVEMKERVSGTILPELTSKGLDPVLVQEALDKRFDEVALYQLRKQMPVLLPEEQRPEFRDPDWDKREDLVPLWITLTHVGFMAWTIINAHHAAFFLLGFLFFLGFAKVTEEFQNEIKLQSAMLVGFFLAGLVIHGGVQGWWIAPVLQSLGEVPLMLGATVLTAFNDNAAITLLATLVPGFTDELKYAVVAGAVTGGGLTVIANAPNPAGQSILKKHFGDAVSPAGLLKAALLPTVICWLCFAWL